MASFISPHQGEDDERSEHVQSTGMDASVLSSQADCLAWIESALPMNGVEIRLLS